MIIMLDLWEKMFYDRKKTKKAMRQIT